MATRACPPNPAPSFIRESDEEAAILGDALRAQEAKGRNVEKRAGHDKKYFRWAASQLENMLPMNTQQVQQWMLDQGWIKLDKEGNFINNAMKGGYEGRVSAVLKDYLASRAGGIKQRADNFLMKVKAGEEATIEGITLAKELRNYGRIGESILGFDQSYGRSMRAQMLRKNPDYQDLVELNDPSKIADDVVDGRALQEAQEQSDLLTNIAKMLNDPEQSAQGVAMLTEVAEMIRFIDDPVAISKASLGVNYVNDLWREWFMNGLLSSPDTWIANAAGALWVPMRAFGQLGGAAMMRVVSPAEGRIVWAQSVAQLAEMKASLGDAMTIAWNGFKTNRFMYADPEGKIQQMITAQNARKLAASQGVEMPDAVADVIGKAGYVLNRPGRILMATDEFAKHIALRGEVANRAVRKAVESGIDVQDTKALQDFVQGEIRKAFILDPQATGDGGASKWFYSPAYDKGSVLGGSRKAISTVAREGTFQEKNRLASGVDNLLAMAPVLKPLLPFVKTPLNIINQGIRETTLVGPALHVMGAAKNNPLNPAGMVMDLQRRLMADPAETARITGQIAFMSTVVGSFFMAETTGGGPDRWVSGNSARRAQQAWLKNNIPYAWKIGDQWVPFNRFPEPVATLMRMTADVKMAAAYLSTEERDDMIGTLVGVGSAGLYSSSMLQGIDDIVSVMRDPGGWDRKMGATVQNWMATQTPLAGMMSFVDRIDDPYRSAYQAPSFTSFFTNWEDTFGYGVLGKVADRFPGVGQRPLQIDQIGGAPVPIYPGVGPGGINPALNNVPLMPRSAPSDAAWQAVFDMTGGWSDYKPDGGLELTPAEQQEVNQRMGTMKIGGKTLAQRILELRARPSTEAYVQNKGLGETGVGTAIKRELDRLKRQYGKAAVIQIMNGNVSITQRAALAREKKQLLRKNDVSGARNRQQLIDQLLEDANRGF